IFKAQLADVDVLDVVLNRRILIVLIPALEKSGDEAANLGKIVAASLKGMMGATLGNTVEGAWETAIGSKQTRSASSFMTVFDEVGYYTARGMAVMAAQARSLGFSLVFASQDLPSMESRAKTEAKSITANCNLKIFGRIEDPTDTKDFVTKHGGTSWVLETKGMTAPTNTISSMFMSMPLYDDRGTASPQSRQRVDYDHLRGQREGEAHLLFADWAYKCRMFYVAPERVKALRVHRFLPVASTTKSTDTRERHMQDLATYLKDPEWKAADVAPAPPVPAEISAMQKGLDAAAGSGRSLLEAGILALAHVAALPAKPKTEASAEMASQPPPASAGKSPVSKSQTAAEARLREAERRAGLPSFQEGDQYAIEEVQKRPAPAAGAVQPAPAASAGASSTGFAVTEADLGVIPQPGFDEEAEGVMDVQLPAEIASLLEQSAKNLSYGLAGAQRK
ncbi:MAG: TraM recognition domain-containing protein, partial [Bdellovibrionales bacterium]